MTLQRLIDIHHPRSIEDCDALVMGNYFGKDVLREDAIRGGILVAHKYTVIHVTVLGVPVKREVAYVRGL